MHKKIEMDNRYVFDDLFDVVSINNGISHLKSQFKEIEKATAGIKTDVPNSGEGLKQMRAELEKINKLREQTNTLIQKEAQSRKILFQSGLNTIQQEERLAKLNAQKARAVTQQEREINKLLAAQQKQLDKENALIAASKKQVKTLDDLTKKNAAFVQIRRKVDLTTKAGRKATEWRQLT